MDQLCYSSQCFQFAAFVIGHHLFTLKPMINDKRTAPNEWVGALHGLLCLRCSFIEKYLHRKNMGVEHHSGHETFDSVKRNI